MSALSQARLKELYVYDPQTGVFTFAVSRAFVLRGAEAGTTDRYGYRRLSVDGKVYLAHRLAWLYQTGAWPSGAIDHINQVRDDNRWENLREASPAENGANAATRSVRDGRRGVHWVPRCRRWCARLRVRGVQVHLSYHTSFSDACSARRAAEQTHLGKFAPSTSHC